PVQQMGAAWLGQPMKLSPKLTDAAVMSPRVREMVRQTLHETVTTILDKVLAPAKPLRGMLGGLAEAASRGILGGVSDEIKRGLEATVREVVDGAVGMAQKRIAQKLQSDETARIIGEERRAFFLQLLQKPEAEAARELEKVPFALVEAMTPVLV